MSKPPCDYCGNPAHYMFGDGEVICSACNSRLPHSSREARKRIAELERENAELRKDAERYRWLTRNGGKTINKDERHALMSYQYWGSPESIDAAIDAALAKIKEES